MENHPIPQDVTGFQFKLIGDITVKQFAYLGAGAFFAWLSYILPLFFLLKFSLILLFIISALALAFLPVAGRPFDEMILHFLKAIFSPNQYVFDKVGGHITIPSITPHQKPAPQQAIHPPTDINSYLSSISHTPKNALDQKELVFMQNLFPNQPQKKAFHLPTFSLPHLPMNPVSSPPPAQQPPEESEPKPSVPHAPNKNEEQLATEAQKLTQEIAPAHTPQTVTSPPQEIQAAPPQSDELQQQLLEVMRQKEQLEMQLSQLTRKIEASVPKQVYTPTQVAEPPPQTEKVRQIPKAMSTKVGLPIVPETPNVVVGIVKDSRGNVLPNILVEIKDQEQNPVRAFKTNPLGQFATATPLLSGTYTIDFEDPGNTHKFDTVQLIANGEIISPLEIISSDAREELRKELFGG